MKHRFNRHDWNRRRRDNRKALEKAIRLHKKRSHLRAIAEELGREKIELLYGGMSNLTTRILCKRSNILADAVFDSNPLMRLLK